MPERRVTIRRPTFEVTPVSPEAARVPRMPTPRAELPPAPPPEPSPQPIPAAPTPAKVLPSLAEAPGPPQVPSQMNSLPPLPAALVDLATRPQPRMAQAADMPPAAPPVGPSAAAPPPVAPPPVAPLMAPAPTPLVMPDPVPPPLDLVPPMPLSGPQVLMPEPLVPRARVAHVYVPPEHAPPDFPAISPAPAPPAAFEEADDLPELQIERPVASSSLRLPFTIAACTVAVLGGAAALLWGAPEPADATITGASASAFATADGRIAHILVTPGARVSRGRDLFEVEPPPPDAAAIVDLEQRRDLARARVSRLESVAQELNRVLSASRPATDAAARRDAEAARQRLRDIQDQARLANDDHARLEADLATLRRRPEQPSRIRADRDGFITQLLVSEGQDVVPGLRVAEMADCNALSLSVDARDAARAGVAGGKEARVMSPSTKTELIVRVPEAGQRAASLNGSRIQIPLDPQAWAKAGGVSCPLGLRVKLTAR